MFNLPSRQSYLLSLGIGYIMFYAMDHLENITKYNLVQNMWDDNARIYELMSTCQIETDYLEDHIYS
jgi:hypothetical protein